MSNGLLQVGSACNPCEQQMLADPNRNGVLPAQGSLATRTRLHDSEGYLFKIINKNLSEQSWLHE